MLLALTGFRSGGDSATRCVAQLCNYVKSIDLWLNRPSCCSCPISFLGKDTIWPDPDYSIDLRFARVRCGRRLSSSFSLFGSQARVTSIHRLPEESGWVQMTKQNLRVDYCTSYYKGLMSTKLTPGNWLSHVCVKRVSENRSYWTTATICEHYCRRSRSPNATSVEVTKWCHIWARFDIRLPGDFCPSFHPRFHNRERVR